MTTFGIIAQQKVIYQTWKNVFDQISSHWEETWKYVVQRSICEKLRAWTNDKCLPTKHHQTLFSWWPNILPFGHLVWCSLIVFDRVWSYLVVFDKMWRPSKHLIKNAKHFFRWRVWWAMFCSFGQPRIEHVWCARAYHVCSKAYINCFICVLSNML